MNNDSLKSYTFENITNGVLDSWMIFFLEHKEKIDSILKKIEDDRLKYNDEINIFPSPDKVFEAFKYFDIQDTKVLLLGQDPYPNSFIHNNKKIPNAVGLSFSVPRETNIIPASLKNIYKELYNDQSNNGFVIPDHGDISCWAKNENIIMLNSALTVIESNPGKHLKIWQPFTDLIINHISNKCNNVVFLLLGNPAKSKIKFIDIKKNHIIEGVHPSPLSAYRGFFGSSIFSKVNSVLKSNGRDEINWNI